MVGVVEGTCAVLAHGRDGGLVLALVAALASLVAAPGGLRRLAFVVGWDGALVALVVRRGEGDVLVDADARGYVLVGLAMAMVVVAVATVRPWSRSHEQSSDPPREMPGTGRPDS